MLSSLRLLFLVALANFIYAIDRERMTKFDPSIEEEYKNFGPVAHSLYTLEMDGYLTNSDQCTDIRRNILVLFHKNKSDPEQAMVTLLRLDNPKACSGDGCAVSKVYSSEYKGWWCDGPNEAMWREYQGWTKPLRLQLKDPAVDIMIPANPDYPMYRVILKIPGLKTPDPKEKEIPKRIIQVVGDHARKKIKSELLVKLMSIMRIMNPNYEYLNYTLDTVCDLIGQWESETAKAACQALAPAAFKVDLFRVVALYHGGGVYADSKITPMVPLDEMVPDTGGFFPWDRKGPPGVEYKNRGIWNGLMAMPKGDPFMRTVIDMIIDNVQRRFYGKECLGITGPLLVAQAFKSLDKEVQHKYDDRLEADSQMTFLFMDRNDTKEEKQMIIHNAEYRHQFSKNYGCHYCGKMFRYRMVYYEKNCSSSNAPSGNKSKGKHPQDASDRNKRAHKHRPQKASQTPHL
jgi:mannosyltransferase OCH1-like enzyme